MIEDDYDGTDFTCITFTPDWKRFHMTGLEADTVSLLKKVPQSPPPHPCVCARLFPVSWPRPSCLSARRRRRGGLAPSFFVHSPDAGLIMRAYPTLLLLNELVNARFCASYRIRAKTAV